VIVSTENPDAAAKQVSELPLKIRSKVSVRERPYNLARDPATILDVVASYLQSLTITDIPDAISVVLPTSPFNSVAAIEGAWGRFRCSDSPKLISVSPSAKPPYNAWVKVESSQPGELTHAFPNSPFKLTQSTACPQTFMSNGCISIYSVETLMGDRNFHSTSGYEMPEIAGVDIDFEYEFEVAKALFPKWACDLEYLKV
jgi:CMP-N-acetylneuraminic acid synthetase